MPTDSEKRAVESGHGIIKNGRYFNTGKTYETDGRIRFDFDKANARDPWFNGDTFHGYDEQGCPIWNPRERG